LNRFFCVCAPILLVLMLLVPTAFAEETPASFSNRVVLTDHQGEYPLGRHLMILEDPTKALTIDDVRSAAYAATFVASTKDVPGFGFSPSAYWVKVDIDRENTRESQWLLEFGYAPMQSVDVYTLHPNGTLVTQKGGRAVRYSESTLPPSQACL
jgi:hypothetical protein